MILALVMVMALAACGGGKSDAVKDVDYVKEKGTLVVGITDFEPMDYRDASGEWIGFDADLARAFAKSLGVEVEFIEIIWDNKHMELETKGIDAVWNGMTLTDDVKELMGTSNAYCKNAQVVVCSADIADQYTTADNLSDLTFAVENGSAGMEALDALGIPYTAADTQAKALMEVAAGSSDACVIDLLMAGAMIGEGTSYPGLTTAVELESEEYGVGFRKDSDLIKTFNDFLKSAYKDGTVTSLAETYGIAKNIIAQ